MKRRHKKKPLKQRLDSLEEVYEFFRKAKPAFKENPALADNYVRKARRTAMKVKLKMPRTLKRRFCKHCYCYLVPGVNCRVRSSRGKMVYYCFQCKRYMRFPYRK